MYKAELIFKGRIIIELIEKDVKTKSGIIIPKEKKEFGGTVVRVLDIMKSLSKDIKEESGIDVKKGDLLMVNAGSIEIGLDLEGKTRLSMPWDSAFIWFKLEVKK